MSAVNSQPVFEGVAAMETITWNDFLKVELRVGRILVVEPFPEARKPAYRLQVDFGPELGVRNRRRQLSAQADRALHVRMPGHRLPHDRG
jgi:tRNA-binding EMAP/Myf-like protein